MAPIVASRGVAVDNNFCCITFFLSSLRSEDPFGILRKRFSFGEWQMVVFSPLSHRDLFRLSTRWTDHDVIPRKVERAKCPGAEESRELVPTIQKWDTLYPARVDPSSLQHRVLHIAHTCKYIRLRIEFQKVRYDELSSSEVDEPVGYDGNARIIQYFHIIYKITITHIKYIT